MTIYDNAGAFGNKAVRDYDPEAGLADAARVAPRVLFPWDEENIERTTYVADVLAPLLADPAAAGVTALVFGNWIFAADDDPAAAIVETLVAAAERLPALRALFLGDITREQCPPPWIPQTDISPLYGAFPALEELRIRGGWRLSLGRLKHDRLKRLVVETSGLDREVLHQVASAELPALEHLELWLGSDGFGWNGTIDDVRPVLDAPGFPRLSSLGLRNSEISDEIARAVVGTPILERIRALDLSLGTLTDEGARALASAGTLGKLQKLDIHECFVSDEGVATLVAAGLEVDARYQHDGYPYVAVPE